MSNRDLASVTGSRYSDISALSGWKASVLIARVSIISFAEAASAERSSLTSVSWSEVSAVSPASVSWVVVSGSVPPVDPHPIIEAARIDGSGEFHTFNNIVLPIMKPAIAVQAIFTFVSSWNNYFVPALVLKKDSVKTLPILIAQLRSADWLKFDMGQVYVTIAFSIFPVIVVYIFLSKYIVQGIALGAVKG